MKKKFEYQVVSGRQRELEEEVSQLLADGWELVGSILVTSDSEITYSSFYQAMKKEYDL